MAEVCKNLPLSSLRQPAQNLMLVTCSGVLRHVVQGNKAGCLQSVDAMNGPSVDAMNGPPSLKVVLRPNSS